MSGPLFTADDVWFGGLYELALELGPRSDDRLRNALRSLWSHPDLRGCFLDRNKEPDDQSQVSPDCIEDGTHLQGVARLPNGASVACGSCVIREVDDGSDWLDFYLPMGSLSTAYPVGGFPFIEDSACDAPWRQVMEDWLASIGGWVAESSSFALGLIGFEVSGHQHAIDLVKGGIPTQRYMAYLWPAGGKVAYYPRNS